jgi:hypothetical protein
LLPTKSQHTGRPDFVENPGKEGGGSFFHIRASDPGMDRFLRINHRHPRGWIGRNDGDSLGRWEGRLRSVLGEPLQDNPDDHQDIDEDESAPHTKYDVYFRKTLRLFLQGLGRIGF